MARPRKLTKKRVSELVKAMEEYTANTDVPILSEFAYQHGVLRETIYDYDEFSTVRKALIAKKEAQLERLALVGVVDKTMAIFSLKQLGWSDKQAVDHTVNGPVEFTLKIGEESGDE